LRLPPPSRRPSADNYSLGLNWYPDNYMRLLVDYVRFDAKKGVTQDEGEALVTRVGVIW